MSLNVPPTPNNNARSLETKDILGVDLCANVRRDLDQPAVQVSQFTYMGPSDDKLAIENKNPNISYSRLECHRRVKERTKLEDQIRRWSAKLNGWRRKKTLYDSLYSQDIAWIMLDDLERANDSLGASGVMGAEVGKSIRARNKARRTQRHKPY